MSAILLRGRQLRAAAGFTLLEVMIALAILLPAIVALVTASERNAVATRRAKALTVATALARARMFDLEEELLFTGFQEMTETLDGDFSEEGYPKIRWSATAEKVQLPPIGAMQQTGDGEDGEAGAGGLGGGLLGGMMGGMLGGMDPTGGMAAAFLPMIYEQITTVLENGIRKITLTVTWKVGRDEESLVVVCYFTDPKAIDAVMPGGSGTGTGTPGGGGLTPGGGGLTPGGGKTPGGGGLTPGGGGLTPGGGGRSATPGGGGFTDRGGSK